MKGSSGNLIFGKITSNSPCRFYVLQNGFDTFSYQMAKESCKYVYSIEQNGDFAIHAMAIDNELEEEAKIKRIQQVHLLCEQFK